MEVKVPEFDGAEDDGEIVDWFVNNGDAVTQGQVLLELMFEKASVEVEAPGSGTIAGITTSAGDIVRAGQVLATIG